MLTQALYPKDLTKKEGDYMQKKTPTTYAFTYVQTTGQPPFMTLTGFAVIVTDVKGKVLKTVEHSTPTDAVGALKEAVGNSTVVSHDLPITLLLLRDLYQPANFYCTLTMSRLKLPYIKMWETKPIGRLCKYCNIFNNEESELLRGATATKDLFFYLSKYIGGAQEVRLYKNVLIKTIESRPVYTPFNAIILK